MFRLLIAFLATIPALAQTNSLQGTITDTLAASVPEAVVTASNLDTSASRMTIFSGCKTTR